LKTKSKTLDIIINIVLTIGIVLCVFLIVFKLCFVKVVVNGNSMQPSIDNGSKGYMIKVNKNSKIERFDVVASEYNSQDDYYIIKRVLGLPFEEVELVNTTPSKSASVAILKPESELITFELLFIT